MFTELPSPVDGVLLEVLVESGQGVKTGTPLFKIATQETAADSTGDVIPQVIDRAFRNRFRLLMAEAAMEQ